MKHYYFYELALNKTNTTLFKVSTLVLLIANLTFPETDWVCWYVLSFSCYLVPPMTFKRNL